MIPIKSIRVGPFDVAVKYLTGMDRDNNLGLFSDTDMSIFIRESYATRQQEAETLLHETLHAIFRVNSLKSKDTEERLVTQISLGFANLFRDNPELIKYMMESFK